MSHVLSEGWTGPGTSSGSLGESRHVGHWGGQGLVLPQEVGVGHVCH